MTATRLVPVVLLALALAGCIQGPGSGGDPLEACAPADGDDPYPEDRIFAARDATVRGETLRLRGCLVNGTDDEVTQDCGSPAGPLRLNVSREEDGEAVLLRPYRDQAILAVCETRTIPANQAWGAARLEMDWDLRKDVCSDDGNCSVEDEGQRVDGGPHRVRIDYPFVEPWTRTVSLPPP